MKTNETLAHDDTRHDDVEAPGAAGGLEKKAGRPTRAARPAAPAVRRADPTAQALRALREQGEQIAHLSRKLTASDARRRLEQLRQRGTAEIRSTLPPSTRARRADPLDAARVNRATAAIVARETRAEAAVRAENRELRRQLETRERQMRRPPLLRAAAGRGAGHSARDQAFALYRRSVLHYLKTGDTAFGGHSLRDLERKAGLHTETNPNGGYLVHPEHDTGPLEQLLLDAVVMRQVATVRPISGASLKKPVSLRGANAKWVGEREDRAETETPNVVELEFPAFELYAKPLASQTMLEDSAIDIEAWLAGEVNDEFAETEEIAYTTGDGVNKPKGFLAYDKVANASWAWGKLGFIATGTDGAFPAVGAQVNQGDPLIQLMYALKAGHRVNARYMANSNSVGVMRRLKDGTGQWIWADARDGLPAMLFGNTEVAVNEQMPDIGSGSYAVAYGDFAKGYVIVDRVGMSVLRDPYSSKPWIEFYTRKRVGGGVQNFEAIKLLKFATS